ncbi:hypothetical protein GDO81_007824 [Engystomops pustulosus]|uniref:BRCT domain-containing protein n=1 Tax=Engystomops pustulosus TaxID=76066 RepID=A0AAV7CAY3_ENGPU|nr:hypothetical protein GDO81_007824 [Engystomops pustulosus]
MRISVRLHPFALHSIFLAVIGEIGEYRHDLFSSVPTIYVSPNSQPSCDKLSEVVQLCGGKVCKTLRPAKICIGMFTGKRPPDLECVSEKWLLDSITQHKLLPLQNYLLLH